MKQNKRVIIFGGKGTAINVAEQIDHARRTHGYPMTVLGFAIDDPSLGNEIAGFPVVSGVVDAWERFRDTDVEFIFALYRPDVMFDRLKLLRGLAIPAERFANFIHPAAYVAPSVSLGHGNVIMSHSSLMHQVSLGNFNIINTSVVIEHDAKIGEGCFLAASACIGARVRLGDGTFVGLNATVREDVSVYDYAFIGMGASVLRNVQNRSVVVGVPAKPTK